MAAIGTEKVLSLLMKSQLPLDGHYLDNGVPWASESAVIAGIPQGSRSPFKMFIIGSSLYWFKANLTEMEPVTFAALVNAINVPISDGAGLYEATEVESALAEVMGYAISIDLSLAQIQDLKKGGFSINFGAYSSVSERISHATETTDYPTSWTLAANSGVNLLIAHNLTGRKISGVNVFEIDGSDERLLQPFKDAYAGITSNGMTVLIEGLAPTLLAIRIELMFN